MRECRTIITCTKLGKYYLNLHISSSMKEYKKIHDVNVIGDRNEMWETMIDLIKTFDLAEVINYFQG